MKTSWNISLNRGNVNPKNLENRSKSVYPGLLV